MTIGKTAELGKTVWKKNVDGTDDNLCQPQVDYLVYYYIEPPKNDIGPTDDWGEPLAESGRVLKQSPFFYTLYANVVRHLVTYQFYDFSDWFPHILQARSQNKF